MYQDDVISKEAAEQYEAVRAEGLFNMFDRIGVGAYARINGMSDLADVAIDREKYSHLLRNCTAIMDGYGIER